MRLLPRPLELPKGSPPPKNGMLDRSTSMLMAPSRVAARTTLTSQVLSDWPASAARSSALALTDSGIRSVIRDSEPSSSSSGAGGGGGAGEVGAVEPDVDAAVGHLGGDLGGGLGDRLHDREPGAGVEGEAEPLGRLTGL